MEVHHHPDLHHKPRRFKEYFLEFLMIFLAVTMGFIAENIREHFTDSKKEKIYAKSLAEDLKTDTANIKAEIKFVLSISKGLDSLTQELFKPASKMNVREVYRLNMLYMRIIGVSFSDVTTAQLKSGGMSFIKNQELANAVSQYWLDEKNITGIADNYLSRFVSATDMGYSIFNRNYYTINYLDTITKLGNIKVDSAAKFVTRDTTQLIIYANRLVVLSMVLKTFYQSNLERQLTEADSLLALIKKEYHIEK